MNKGPMRFAKPSIHKKVLCVCTMNLLRSPTAQIVLGQAPFNFDTRSAGTCIAALVKARPTLINWADEVVCMEEEHAVEVRKLASRSEPKIIVLNIPDNFEYRDPYLMTLIAERYSQRMAGL